MTLQRVFEDDEYYPAHSTLMVRDSGECGMDTAEHPTLAEDASSEWGTVALAGWGWLQGRANSGEYNRVRMEAHDGQPADDRASWVDVLETCYGSDTGVVVLTELIPADSDDDLELMRPGLHRVRVSRRPDADGGDQWRLQFWPVEHAEPPRWLARGPVDDEMPDDHWDLVLPYPVREAQWQIESAIGDPPVTATELFERLATTSGRQWLDAPLWPELPPLLPTGHADLDAAGARDRETYRAQMLGEKARFDEMAVQLGVAAPSTPRELLPMLVAAGVLRAEPADGVIRYARVENPPPIGEVLHLPDDLRVAVAAQDGSDRYSDVADDIVSIVRWSEPEDRFTVAGMAGRLLLPAELVRGALHYAVAEGTLLLEGNADGDFPFAAIAPAKQDEYESAYAVEEGDDDDFDDDLDDEEFWDPREPDPAFLGHMPHPPGPHGPVHMDGPSHARFLSGALERWSRPSGAEAGVDSVLVAVTDDDSWEENFEDDGPAFPQGAPPRAGVLCEDGQLTFWRDSRWVVAATCAGADHALETPYGTLVIGGRGHALVRPDASMVALGRDLGYHGALSEDGRYFAVHEEHYGRKSWFRMHVYDLADGTRVTMPWDDQHRLWVTAMYGGTVYFQADPDHGPAASSDEQVPMQWTPGTEALPAEERVLQVDPISGARLSLSAQPGLLLRRPGKPPLQLRLDVSARLTPGAERLVTYRHEPPAVALFDPATAPAGPQVLWLPRDAEVSDSVPWGPVWGSPHHLLVMRRHRMEPDALRIDVRTGGIERVPLPPDAGDTPAFVQPFLR